jgi:SecD/SecF fusion protein
MQIDQTFVAAILTVIGYALNDNVIVFDRIREEIHNNPRKDVNTLANVAINKTLGRTINTSITTFIVILIVFLFGGDSLKGFMLAMGIGVIVGTYSSVFVATPVMLDLSKKASDKKALKAQK